MINRMYKLTRKYKTDRIPKVESLLDSLSTQVNNLNPKGINNTGVIFEATGEHIIRITRSVNNAIETSVINHHLRRCKWKHKKNK